MKARALNPRKPNEVTQDERAFSEWHWFVENFYLRRYEAITFKMGEFRYTPDFSALEIETGQPCFFEVKASDSVHAFTPVAKLRLQATAEAFPEYRFYAVWPIKGSKRQDWNIQEISNKTRNVGDF
jgi:hypothetical protein